MNLDGVQLGLWEAGEEQEGVFYQQSVDSPEGVRAFEAGGDALPGTGQGLNLVNEHHHKVGGLGNMLPDHIKHPLHQLAALPHPLGGQAVAVDLHQKTLTDIKIKEGEFSNLLEATVLLPGQVDGQLVGKGAAEGSLAGARGTVQQGHPVYTNLRTESQSRKDILRIHLVGIHLGPGQLQTGLDGVHQVDLDSSLKDQGLPGNVNTKESSTIKVYQSPSRAELGRAMVEALVFIFEVTMNN